MKMYLTRIANSSLVPLCHDVRCLGRWLTEPGTDPTAPIEAVCDGPGWCVHCHICGQAVWTPDVCCLHDDRCPQRRWDLTRDAQLYSAALTAHRPAVPLPADALEQAEALADEGVGPRDAAHRILGLPRPGP